MKKLIALTLALFFPFTTFASVQVISQSFASAISSNTVAKYMSLNAQSLANNGDNNALPRTVFPVAGTLSNLRVNADYAPGGTGSWAVTIRKNGVNSSVTCTIGSADTTCSDLVNSVAVVAGDKVVIEFAPTNTPLVVRFSAVFDFTPTTANETVLIGEDASINTTANRYSSLSGELSASQFESLRQLLIPSAGVMSLLRATTTATGAARSWDFYLRQAVIGGSIATTSLTCNITNGTTCVDSVNTVNIAADDLISISTVPTNTPASTALGISARFVPTVAGDFIFTSVFTSGDGNTAYHPLNGTGTGAITTQASTTVVSNAMTVTRISVSITTASGLGKSRVFSLDVNGVASALTCTIAGTTAKTCTGTGAVVVAAGDLLNVSNIGAGGPASTGIGSIALTANRNAAAGAASGAGVSARNKFSGGFVRFLGGMFRFK